MVKIGLLLKGCSLCRDPIQLLFRLWAVALVRAEKTIRSVATSLGVSQAALHGWARQDRID